MTALPLVPAYRLMHAQFQQLADALPVAVCDSSSIYNCQNPHHTADCGLHHVAQADIGHGPRRFDDKHCFAAKRRVADNVDT
ncbi:hypothetical protein NX02_24835 [Sphingomonas sanxanigenens DSM 19645 = NX02]|uniref:Uncharacterized protein n=1 Tax=Sphingomonas sanxanigenens DSM 19645 = NX02 TaxID=1123269 RepID=W0AFB3_9SPHN|nr:hypothetical protein NX02_24835 [Sphingomonas sanxanigenens DSM 19645 = NX02]